MQAADILALERNNVIDVVAYRSAKAIPIIDPLTLGLSQPRWG